MTVSDLERCAEAPARAATEQSRDTLTLMVGSRKRRVTRRITLLVVAAIVFAPGSETFDSLEQQTGPKAGLTARMLAPTFDEALTKSQTTAEVELSALKAQNKVVRSDADAAAALVSLMIFLLGATAIGHPSSLSRIQARGGAAGIFGSRSPPHLQLA